MISVTQEMHADIENFRFENRYETRSSAVEALIRLGLNAAKNQSGVPIKAPAPTIESVEELLFEAIDHYKKKDLP